ncbi:MAG: ATP-grasp domain-containing protein [Planctomycetes bacterium]|nr:ATP-grasp domain-containing protein [Planctomycetota bacterium]
MRVFVYEYLTALGIGRDPASPEHGMYREGLAMRDALIADFALIPDEAVHWSVVIAPESDGILARTAQQVLRGLVSGNSPPTVSQSLDTSPTRGEDKTQERASLFLPSPLVGEGGESSSRVGGKPLVAERLALGSQLLGPSFHAIQLTSDKLALSQHWREHGVRTPATTDREPTRCEVFPVVWKPQDGAGSTATFKLNSYFDATSAKARLAAENHTGPMILQQFVSGQAASVAFLCGPAGNVPLLPTFQLLSDDGRFKYLGGELPIPSELAERATRLAQRAVDCVPGLLGYVGVDLVLGDAADGSRDFAIEINPRLTTSYVGLRALADFNIAEAMLRIAKGELRDSLRWKPGRVRFGPDGSVQAI